MSGFEIKEWINASPKLVFEMMTNLDNASIVNPNIKKVEILYGDAIQKGARLREIRIVNGKEAQTDLLVEDIEHPTLYSVSAEQSGIKILYTYELKPEKGGTVIKLTCDVNGVGLKKLMLPVVASIMKREDGNHLENLKKLVESKVAALSG